MVIYSGEVKALSLNIHCILIQHYNNCGTKYVLFTKPTDTIKHMLTMLHNFFYISFENS